MNSTAKPAARSVRVTTRSKDNTPSKKSRYKDLKQNQGPKYKCPGCGRHFYQGGMRDGYCIEGCATNTKGTQ